MVHGIALPNGDKHFGPILEGSPRDRGKPTYQVSKLNRATDLCRGRGLALDVGAHVGLWARVLAGRFARVIAFEPIPEHIACLTHNVAAEPNVEIRPYGLSFRSDVVKMIAPGANSGNARVAVDGPIIAQVRALDELGIRGVDFLKIDVEGFEMFVLQGARETIRRDRPVIVVEQKPDNPQFYGLGQFDAITLLKEWGYALAWEQGGDYCLTA